MLKNFKNGFTIVEALLAMTIISIGLLGVSSLVIQNFQVQSVNRDYLIASMLAQEGVELVRNIRDTNWFTDGANWDEGIVGNYAIDFDDAPDFDVSGINDEVHARLRLNSGLYSHNAGGTDTPFYRLLTTTLNGDALNVTCQVQWNERGRTHNYIAETVLYNWK